MIKYLFAIFSLITILVSCHTNDYREEYQKELRYDGYATPLDSILIDTYHATDSG